MAMRAFAKNLAALLESRELTQGQVEILTRGKVKRSHISMIVSDQRDPKITTATALARALDVSLDWLCDIQRRQEGELTPDEAEVLDAYRDIPPEVQPMVLNSVKGFVKK